VHNFMDITDFQNLSPKDLNVTITQSFPSQPHHKELVNSLIAQLSVAQLKHWDQSLSDFFNRYYKADTGVKAANYIFGEFSDMGKNNDHFNVLHFPHSGFPQPSIIARIEGTGPFADEIVILGAHEDSTAGGINNLAPGADDDASGSSTVLEIFRVLMESGWQPARTVEFHTYAAEEAGLLGSQAVANAYQKEGKKVYSMMQLDMTMYTKSNQFGVVMDYVNLPLTQFVKILVDTYSNIEWVETKCGYSCSDHASWTRAGYASCFPFEGPFSQSNPFIHSSQDLLSKLSLTHGMEFAKVALAYVIELGSAPVDK